MYCEHRINPHPCTHTIRTRKEKVSVIDDGDRELQPDFTLKVSPIPSPPSLNERMSKVELTLAQALDWLKQQHYQQQTLSDLFPGSSNNHLHYLPCYHSLSPTSLLLHPSNHSLSPTSLLLHPSNHSLSPASLLPRISHHLLSPPPHTSHPLLSPPSPPPPTSHHSLALLPQASNRVSRCHFHRPAIYQRTIKRFPTGLKMS